MCSKGITTRLTHEGPFVLLLALCWTSPLRRFDRSADPRITRRLWGPAIVLPWKPNKDTCHDRLALPFQSYMYAEVLPPTCIEPRDFETDRGISASALYRNAKDARQYLTGRGHRSDCGCATISTCENRQHRAAEATTPRHGFPAREPQIFAICEDLQEHFWGAGRSATGFLALRQPPNS